jgi:hypothetical protein
MAKTKQIVVDGVTYYSAKPSEYDGTIKIVILQRGWCMVGKFERNGSECKLHNAFVIRTWGTTKGLGEIAENGPTDSTKLDKTNGLVEFDYLTVVATISCNEDNWKDCL